MSNQYFVASQIMIHVWRQFFESVYWGWGGLNLTQPGDWFGLDWG